MNVVAVVPAREVFPVTFRVAIDMSVQLMAPVTCRLVAETEPRLLAPVTERFEAVVEAKVVAPDTASEVALVALKLATLVAPDKVKFPAVSVRFPVGRWVVPKVLAPVTVSADAVVLARAVAPETDNEVARVVLKLATLVAPNKIRFPPASVRFPVGRWVVPKVLAPVTVSADAVVLAREVAPETDNEVARVVLKLATLVAPNKIRFPPASVRFPVGRWVVPKVLAPVTVSADAVVLARVVAPETDNDVAWAVLKLATLVAPDKVKFPDASVRFPVGRWVVPKVLEPETFKLDPVSVVKLPPPVEVTLVADKP
jgi:hypothetical protein